MNLKIKTIKIEKVTLAWAVIKLEKEKITRKCISVEIRAWAKVVKIFVKLEKFLAEWKANNQSQLNISDGYGSKSSP